MYGQLTDHMLIEKYWLANLFLGSVVPVHTPWTASMEFRFSAL
jgi:hypothetical protein